MNNITGALLDAGIGGEPISEEEFGWMFVLILVGGNESTRTVIAQGMSYLYNQLRSFGIGQHFCIGSHLARMELRVMFEEIIPRLRNPKFAAQPEFVRPYFVNVMKAMPISFDAKL
jgi:cytochrome P450